MVKRRTFLGLTALLITSSVHCSFGAGIAPVEIKLDITELLTQVSGWCSNLMTLYKESKSEAIKSQIPSIVDTLLKLASIKRSFAGNLAAYYQHDVGLHYADGELMRRNIWRMNDLFKQLFDQIDNIDPHWTSSHVDLTILSQRVMNDKRQFIYDSVTIVKRELQPGSPAEATAKGLFDKFNEEADKIESLAKALAASIQ